MELDKRKINETIKFNEKQMEKYENPENLEDARLHGFHDGYICALNRLLENE